MISEEKNQNMQGPSDLDELFKDYEGDLQKAFEQRVEDGTDAREMEQFRVKSKAEFERMQKNGAIEDPSDEDEDEDEDEDDKEFD